MYFIKELQRRNSLLYWYGLLNLVGAVICIILWQTTDLTVLGVNAYIKPFKFFASIFIFVWSMGWFLHYLDRPAKVRSYSIMAVTVLAYESFVITWQAANGRLSHFNFSTPIYYSLFLVMGLAITLLTLWTGHICYLFFKQKVSQIPTAYLWGIRLGLLFFVIFALEGGVMGALLRHTVGGKDGGSGITVLNWSREHGDLRIAHFFGMHALQLFPLIGYYITRNSKVVIGLALGYMIILVAVLVEALMGLPLV